MNQSSPLKLKNKKHFNDTIKVETIKIIEERDRNLFTGKWGDESTASLKEKIINIRYEQK